MIITNTRGTIRFVGILFCLFLIAGNVLWAAEAQDFSTNLFQFLENEIKLSTGELKSVRAGRVVTKKLDTDVKQEVAMFSIARLAVAPEAFLTRYGQGTFSIELIKADAWGTFSTPPKPEDIQKLAVPSTDIKDLKKSEIGDSKVKGPVALLDAFRALDPSASDYQQQADAVLQSNLLQYAQQYLQQGNAGLIEYDDKKDPIKVAEEFQDILAQSPYLGTYRPELRAYLEQYPGGQLPGAENHLFWMVENFGGQANRPTITMNHFITYQPPDGELWAASKQIYANHYYEAALGLTVMVDDPETTEPGVYLLHISRSRIDALRSVPGFLAGDLYKGAEDLLDEKMTLIKQQIETK